MDMISNPESPERDVVMEAAEQLAKRLAAEYPELRVVVWECVDSAFEVRVKLPFWHVIRSFHPPDGEGE